MQPNVRDYMHTATVDKPYACHIIVPIRNTDFQPQEATDRVW